MMKLATIVLIASLSFTTNARIELPPYHHGMTMEHL